MELKDIAVIYDCPHSTAPDEGVGYALIRTPNIGKGRLLLDNVHRVSKEVYDNRNRRAIPQEGDIIFAREAPAGNAALITRGQKVCLGQRTVLIKPNHSVCDSGFLVYYLLAPEQQTKLLGFSHGATVQHVNISELSKLSISLPSLYVQHRIASILSAYDNLIENNNRRIRLLEQMAENLYKEWFVRFRFPGHEKVEFENGLPKEWPIKKLGEFIKFERGVGYGSKDIIDGENVLLSMNNIRPYGGFKRDYSRLYSGKFKEFQKVNEGDLIMSITDMTQDRRIIGYTGIVPPGKDNRIICTHLVKLSSEISHTYFLNGLFNYSNLSRIIAERATGANVLGLTADILKGVKTLLPPTELQSMYVTKVTPIIEECFSLQDANDNLARQRDLLLPRLMSGKLEVKI